MCLKGMLFIDVTAFKTDPESAVSPRCWGVAEGHRDRRKPQRGSPFLFRLPLFSLERRRYGARLACIQSA